MKGEFMATLFSRMRVDQSVWHVPCHIKAIVSIALIGIVTFILFPSDVVRFWCLFGTFAAVCLTCYFIKLNDDLDRWRDNLGSQTDPGANWKFGLPFTVIVLVVVLICIALVVCYLLIYGLCWAGYAIYWFITNVVFVPAAAL